MGEAREELVALEKDYEEVGVETETIDSTAATRKKRAARNTSSTFPGVVFFRCSSKTTIII